MPQLPAADEPAVADERRRRDRHGRGMRGPLAPRGVPLARTRALAFDDLVLDSVERIEEHLARTTNEAIAARLGSVEFGIEEVPPEATLSLGRCEEPSQSHGGRVVVYRRPIELRAKAPDERADLVHEVVVDQLAELFAVSPETLDPS